MIPVKIYRNTNKLFVVEYPGNDVREYVSSNDFIIQLINNTFIEIFSIGQSDFRRQIPHRILKATRFTDIQDESGAYISGTFQNVVDYIEKEININLTLITNYKADNYTQLTTVLAIDPDEGETAYVINSEGTAWLPGSLGGSFRSKGVYYYNGTEWISDKSEIAEQLSINIEDIDNIELVNISQDTLISNNTTQIGINTTDIGTNATNIGTNSTNIGTNVTNISTNANDISDNTDDILANAGLNIGSVTVHNDVDDAGSGEIITDQERIDINSSIDVHNDVTLTGVSPEDGWILKFVGGQWIPVMKKIIRSTALQINNVVAFEEKINQNVDFQRLGIYSIQVSFTASLNTGAQDFISRISINGTQLPNITTNEMVRVEPKDVAGDDGDGRRTNQKVTHSQKYFYTVVSTGNKPVILSFAASTANDAAAMWDAEITIEEEFNIIGS